MIARIFDIPVFCAQNYPKDDAFAVKRDGRWEKTSTFEYLEYANLISFGLLDLGFRKNDKIATITINNRPEWNFVDMGMSQIGVIQVPVYPTISDSDFEFILLDSDVKLIFVADEFLYERARPISLKINDFKGIYSFDKIENKSNWLDIVKRGIEKHNQFQTVLEEIKNSILPDDYSTLLYTSGTTGLPKGVMLSHLNLTSNIIVASKLQPLGHKDRILSFLPICHIYERTANYQFQYSGTSIYYAENFGSIPDNLREIRADGIVAVPRFLEKIHEAMLTRGNELTGFRRKIFTWALNIGYAYNECHQNSFWFRIKSWIANLMVFRKFRSGLGGKLRFIGCGGAHLQPKLEKLFWAARLPVYQGYGLTETSPLISLNSYKRNCCMLGTVGPVIENVEVKIADDGEILCRGPNLMKGYYRNHVVSKNILDSEGWFQTGDIGMFVNKKFLKITGRKKNLFKTAYGKYIAPQMIESRFRESKWIEQLMVIGEGEKFAGALISPNFELLGNWAKSIKEIHVGDRKKLIQMPEVIARIENEINLYNQSLGNQEQIKQFHLVGDEWSVQTGELTPSLKLRRDFIRSKYRKLIRKIYGKSRE